MQTLKKIKNYAISFYFGLPIYILKDINRIVFCIIYSYFILCSWIPLVLIYTPFYITKIVYLNFINFIWSFIDTYYIYKFSIFLVYFIIKILVFHPLASLLIIILLFHSCFFMFILVNFYKVKLLFKFLYLFYITYDFSEKLVTIVITIIFLWNQIFVLNFYIFLNWLDIHILAMLTDTCPILIEDYKAMHSIWDWAAKLHDEFIPRRLHERELILNFSDQYLKGNYYLDELRVWVQYFANIPYHENLINFIKPDPNEPITVGLSLMEKWVLTSLYYFFWACVIGIACLMCFFLTSNPRSIHCNLWYNITWRITLFIFSIWFFLEFIIFTIDINSIIKIQLRVDFIDYITTKLNSTSLFYIFFGHLLPHWVILVFLLLTWYLIKKNYHNNIIFFIFYNFMISIYFALNIDIQYPFTAQRVIWFYWVSVDRLVQYYYIFKHPSSVLHTLTLFDFFFIPFILFVIWYIYYICRLILYCWPVFYKNILRPAVKIISRNSATMLALFGRSFVDEDDYIERTMESELNSWLGVVIKRSNIENRLEWDEFVEIDAFIINFYLTAWTFAYEEKLRRIENYMFENLDLTRIWEPIFDSTKFKYPPRPDAETILMIREKIYEMGEEDFYKLTVNSYWSLFVPESMIDISDVKFYDITNEPQRNMNDSALTWDEERHPYHFGCNILRITGQGFHEQIQSFTYQEYGEIARNIMTLRILYGEEGYVEDPDTILDEFFQIHEKLSNTECFCEQDEINLKLKIKEANDNALLHDYWSKIRINWDFIDGITTKSPKFKSLVQDFEPALECKTNFEKEREGFLRIPLPIDQEISVRAFIPTKQEALKASWLFIGGLWYRTNNYYGISTTIPLYEIAIGKDKLLVLQNVDAIKKQLLINKELFDKLNIWIKKEVYLKEENLTTSIQEMPFFLRREDISRTKEGWLEWKRRIFTPDSFENYFDKSKKKPLKITFIPIRYEKIKDFEYYDEAIPDPREKIYKKKKKRKFV